MCMCTSSVWACWREATSVALTWSISINLSISALIAAMTWRSCPQPSCSRWIAEDSAVTLAYPTTYIHTYTYNLTRKTKLLAKDETASFCSAIHTIRDVLYKRKYLVFGFPLQSARVQLIELHLLVLQSIRMNVKKFVTLHTYIHTYIQRDSFTIIPSRGLWVGRSYSLQPAGHSRSYTYMHLYIHTYVFNSNTNTNTNINIGMHAVYIYQLGTL